MSLETVRSAATAAIDAGNRNGVAEVIKSYGVAKITEIDESKYAEVLEAIKAL